MLTNTQKNLNKLESLFTVLGYKIRYEKGSFRTGSCVLQHTKVVVINRFANLEVKVQSLIQLLQELPADPRLLAAKDLALYQAILKMDIAV